MVRDRDVVFDWIHGSVTTSVHHPFAIVSHSQEDDRYLTAEDVAQLLGWSPKQVLRKQPELGGIRLGHRTVRFPLSAVRQFVRLRTV